MNALPLYSCPAFAIAELCDKAHLGKADVLHIEFDAAGTQLVLRDDRGFESGFDVASVDQYLLAGGRAAPGQKDDSKHLFGGSQVAACLVRMCAPSRLHGVHRMHALHAWPVNNLCPHCGVELAGA